MKKSILLTMCCLLFACSEAGIHTCELNVLKTPVVVVSNGDKGGVLLQGSDGKFFLAKYDTYLGGSLKNAIPGTLLGAKIQEPRGYRYASKLITCRKCGKETVVNGEECK